MIKARMARMGRRTCAVLELHVEMYIVLCELLRTADEASCDPGDLGVAGKSSLLNFLELTDASRRESSPPPPPQSLSSLQPRRTHRIPTTREWQLLAINIKTVPFNSQVCGTVYIDALHMYRDDTAPAALPRLSRIQTSTNGIIRSSKRAKKMFSRIINRSEPFLECAQHRKSNKRSLPRQGSNEEVLQQSIAI